MVRATSKIKKGGIFLVRWGIQGRIIQGDHSTGHCSVLRNLIKIKIVIIMKLRKYAPQTKFLLKIF